MKPNRNLRPAVARPSQPAAPAFELQPFEPRLLMSVSTQKDAAVVINTSVGEVAVALDPTAPGTVANFLRYVNAKLYDGTIIHRTQVQASDGIGIVQGGGYIPLGSNYTHIATFPPIANEFSTSRPNVRGTIAMAKTSDPNSATSEFFFNTSNNPALDSTSNSGGFTTFGRVFNGIFVLDQINALNQGSATTVNSSGQTNGTLSDVPTTLFGSKIKVNFAAARDLTTVTIGAGSTDRAVRFNDGDNVIGTVSLAGGGAASIKVTGTNLTTRRLADGTIVVKGTNTELQTIDMTGTTARSTLRLDGGGAFRQLDVGTITADSTIGSIMGTATNVHGDITLSGGVGRINLLAVQNAGTITLGKPASGTMSAELNINALDNASLASSEPISRLVTRGWTVSDFTTSRSFSAPSVGRIVSYGSFGASLSVTGRVETIQATSLSGSVTAASIGSANLGQISGGSLTATSVTGQGIGSVTVTGAMSNATVRSAASIGRVTAGTMSSSTVVAGVTSAPSFGKYPTSFNNNAASIGAVRVVGGPLGFNGSRIAAPTIGTASLGRVATTPFTVDPKSRKKTFDTTSDTGLKADKIGSLIATTQDGQSLRANNLDTQAQFNALVTQRKLTLRRFSVVLI